MNIHKILHPILKRFIKFPQNLIELNKMPSVNDKAIYAFNHSCRWDVSIAFFVVKRPVYVLAGKQRLEFLDWLGIVLNGCVWVDRQDKKSGKDSMKKMEKILLKGNGMVIFPEATWNLTESEPMLPIYWGVIELAKRTSAPIIPIILEYRGNNCYVKYGEAVYVSKSDDKRKKAEFLEDSMATIKWDIWGNFEIERRSNVFADVWNIEKERRLKEYPKLDWKYEKSCIRKL